MKKKNVHRLFVSFMVIGAIILFAMAGASDSELMEFRSIVVGVLVGLIFMLTGFHGLKVTGWDGID